MSMKSTISAGSAKSEPVFDLTAWAPELRRRSGPLNEPDPRLQDGYFSRAWISSLASSIDLLDGLVAEQDALDAVEIGLHDLHPVLVHRDRPPIGQHLGERLQHRVFETRQLDRGRAGRERVRVVALVLGRVQELQELLGLGLVLSALRNDIAPTAENGRGLLAGRCGDRHRPELDVRVFLLDRRKIELARTDRPKRCRQ